MKTPIELIAEERERQQEKEGWTLEHDDEHDGGELAMAAALYASPDDELMIAASCSHCDEVKAYDPWPWNNTIEPPRGGPFVNVHAWDKRE